MAVGVARACGAPLRIPDPPLAVPERAANVQTDVHCSYPLMRKGRSAPPGPAFAPAQVRWMGRLVRSQAASPRPWRELAMLS